MLAEDSWTHLALGPFPDPGSRPSSQGSSPGVSGTLQKLPHASPASAAALLDMHKENSNLAYSAFLVCRFSIFKMSA